MSIDFTELAAWFSARSAWQQDAARRLFQTGCLTEFDLVDLRILCEREAGIEITNPPELKAVPIPAAALRVTGTGVSIRLEAISEVRGINALAPRNPLEFSRDHLTVVYGSNGSGKSGYIRVLKHMCGGRGLRTLHPHAFQTSKLDQVCTVRYTHGLNTKTLKWTPAVGIHDDLRSISLFDNDCANVYMTSENEVAYEPPLLSYFRRLVEVCENLSVGLKQDIASKASTKPKLPDEYAVAVAGKWYGTLAHNTTEAAIIKNCSWSPQLELELTSTLQRASETNPTEKAKALRKRKGHVHALGVLIQQIETALNDASYETLMTARGNASLKRRASDEDAKKVFENAPLEGVASPSWQLLWDAARQYSESIAYPDKPFPHLEGDALCVLCQQPLDANSDVRSRLTSFETFVKGALESEAKAAEETLSTWLANLKDIPSEPEVDIHLDLSAITEVLLRNSVQDRFSQLKLRRESMLKATVLEDVHPLPPSATLQSLTELVSTLEADAKSYDGDAQKDNKSELADKLREFRCQKWLSEQRAAITTEKLRLSEVALLEKALRSTNTKALSDKKTALSEQLITAAFVTRFEDELKLLGGARLKVTIEKTRTTKGQVWHRVGLKDNSRPLLMSEVLSEGELRVVSIAAFLADVAVSQDTAGFIFDDPISSLDQDFEERTALRLAAMSKSRQVIVFTHRLSLLHLLEEATKKELVKCKVVSLQRESWGAGEPGEPPLPAQKPAKALNSLIESRFPKLKKVWQDEGNDAYQIHAKAICGDIRITLERLIEIELLADVVQRFRRPINTIGKIEKLARIKPEDCKLFDKLMTKYSRYEHAQPDEAPVSLPEPDELETDLKNLKTWLDEFGTRVIVGATV